MNDLKIGDEVYVLGKNATGKVAFIGNTHFSDGLWFGVILDEPKGRNNGNFDGVSYFKCSRNHGIFVRSCQLAKKDLQNKEYSIKSLQKTRPKIPYPNYLRNVLTCKRIKKLNQFWDKNSISEKWAERKSLSKLHPKTTVKLANVTKQKELSKVNENIIFMQNKLKIAEDMVAMSLKSQEELVKTVNIVETKLENSRKRVSMLKKQLKKAKMELAEPGKVKRMVKLRFEQLMDVVETAIIEKEIAEEKCELFETKLQESKESCEEMQIELDICKEEMQLQCVNQVPAVHYLKQLENENKVLNNALLKLQEEYFYKQQKLCEAECVIKANSDEIAILKGDQQILTEDIYNYKRKVSELCETIDCISNAEYIVFQITQKNLNAEQKIEQLHIELNTVEEQLDVSKEIEEVLQDLKTGYKKDLEESRSRANKAEKALDFLVHLIHDRDSTIAKYRDLTSNLRRTNCDMAYELNKLLEERKETVVKAETLKLKADNEEKKNLGDLIQRARIEVELEIANQRITYLSAFLPDSFFAEKGNYHVLEIMLLLSKMIKKTTILTNHLNSKYFILEDYLKVHDLQSMTFATRFLLESFELRNLLTLHSIFLDHAHLKLFVPPHKHHHSLIEMDKEIDKYLDSLSKNEIDREENLLSLHKTLNSLRNILDTKVCYISNESSHKSLCHIEIISISCKCICAYCAALEISKSEMNSVVKNSLIYIRRHSLKLIKYASFLQNYIQDSARQKQILLNPGSSYRLGQHVEKITEVMDCLIEFYNNTKYTETECTEDARNIIETALDDLNKQMKVTASDLEFLCSSVKGGDNLTELTLEPSYLPSIFSLAQNLKQENENMLRKLRLELMISETERLKLSKSLATAKKYQTIATVRKPIKDKATQTSPKIEAKCPPNTIPMEHSLKLKVDDMFCTMRYLRYKNFQMQMERIDNQFSLLTPLKLPPKSKYHPEVHALFILQNKLKDISRKMMQILFPVVVDISKRGKAKEKTMTSYFIQQALNRKEIEHSLSSLKAEITDFRNSYTYSRKGGTKFMNI